MVPINTNNAASSHHTTRVILAEEGLPVSGRTAEKVGGGEKNAIGGIVSWEKRERKGEGKWLLLATMIHFLPFPHRFHPPFQCSFSFQSCIVRCVPNFGDGAYSVAMERERVGSPRLFRTHTQPYLFPHRLSSDAD